MSSLQVATIARIPIKIHWTFGLFVLFVLGYGLSNDMRGIDLVWFLGFVMAMFICVICHEYGHALTARRYGIKTIDIIISPIGGLARLEKLPERPLQELIVAIAGPLVNLVIAAILFTSLFVITSDADLIKATNDIENIATPVGFCALLILTNIVLFVFNLIPAFPMDGGRILRAGLSMKFGRVRGTQYAALVGRVLAVGFVILGVLYSEYMVALIGIFVFTMAGSESRQVALEDVLSKATAADIMNPNFTKVHISETMRDVYDRYIRGGEKNYLVFDSMGNLSGTIPEIFIRQAYREGILDTTTTNEYMSKNFGSIEQDISLKDLFVKMNQDGLAIVGIQDENAEVVAAVDRSMIQTYMSLGK